MKNIEKRIRKEVRREVAKCRMFSFLEAVCPLFFRGDSTPGIQVVSKTIIDISLVLICTLAIKNPGPLANACYFLALFPGAFSLLLTYLCYEKVDSNWIYQIEDEVTQKYKMYEPKETILSVGKTNVLQQTNEKREAKTSIKPINHNYVEFSRVQTKNRVKTKTRK